MVIYLFIQPDRDSETNKYQKRTTILRTIIIVKFNNKLKSISITISH